MAHIVWKVKDHEDNDAHLSADLGGIVMVLGIQKSGATVCDIQQLGLK